MSFRIKIMLIVILLCVNGCATTTEPTSLTPISVQQISTSIPPTKINASPTFYHLVDTPIPLNQESFPSFSKENFPLWFQQPICDLPCWWGIQPGGTSWDEATDVFESFGVVKNPNWTKEKTSFVPFENSAIDFHFALKVDHTSDVVQNIEIVSHIYDWQTQSDFQQFWSAYSPQGIFQKYGVPSSVFLSKPDRTIPSFSLWLVYEHIGFTISFNWNFPPSEIMEPSQVCPDMKNNGINLIAVFLQNKNDGTRLLDADFAKRKIATGNWKTPEDLIQVSVVEFYDQVIQNSDYCFNVQQ